MYGSNRIVDGKFKQPNNQLKCDSLLKAHEIDDANLVTDYIGKYLKYNYI